MKGWVSLFEGNYVHRTWTRLFLDSMERAWFAGQHDFTWLCLVCIHKSDALTEEEKSVALSSIKATSERRIAETFERNKILFKKTSGY